MPFWSEKPLCARMTRDKSSRRCSLTNPDFSFYGAKMKVTLRKSGKLAFEAETESGHTIITDGSPDNGGQNLGARPMEMILVGLGGCSGIDVSLILEKSRQQVTDCVIEVDAQRTDSIPSVFTNIHLQFTLSGKQLDEKRVARAVSLSMEKYCSVTRMLEPSVKITSSFSILEG